MNTLNKVTTDTIVQAETIESLSAQVLALQVLEDNEGTKLEYRSEDVSKLEQDLEIYKIALKIAAGTIAFWKKQVPALNSNLVLTDEWFVEKAQQTLKENRKLTI